MHFLNCRIVADAALAYRIAELFLFDFIIFIFTLIPFIEDCFAFVSAAVAVFNAYKRKKEVEAAETEKRKEDILAGKLVETGKGDSTTQSPTSSRQNKAAKPKKSSASASRSRQNESIVWSHFHGGPGAKEKWFWDNTTTPASKRSICVLCDKTISAASTTNLRAHLQAKHTDLVLKELRADETLEVGKIATLATLKEDFGAVEKFSGSFKASLDESCVKMCCKKNRPLSMGELDRELKSWVLQISRGRYQPPARKTCHDLVLTMRAKAENSTKKLVVALRKDNVLSFISGEQSLVIC